MKKKKNSFFAFCFSLIPGACHMYLGFMKQGISIMLLLVANIIFAIVTGLGILTIFIPILWFYAFFDAHNKRALNDEAFEQLEDKFLFANVRGDEFVHLLQGKLRPIMAGILIFIGVYILYENLMSMLVHVIPYDIFRSFYYSVLSKMPRIVTACIIVYIGVRLITGKRNELKSVDSLQKKEEVVVAMESENNFYSNTKIEETRNSEDGVINE